LRVLTSQEFTKTGVNRGNGSKSVVIAIMRWIGVAETNKMMKENVKRTKINKTFGL